MILEILLLLCFLCRHLHEILQLVRCHHQWVQHLDSELSLDLRAHRSAITLFMTVGSPSQDTVRRRSSCGFLQTSLLG